MGTYCVQTVKTNYSKNNRKMKTCFDYAKEIQSEYESVWHPPYVLMEIVVLTKPKYLAIDHYGRRLAGASNVKEFRYNLNRKFSV
jgi:hypothetical protein